MSTIDSRGGRPPRNNSRGGGRASISGPPVFADIPAPSPVSTPLNTPTSDPLQSSPTKRQVVRVLSNANGMLTFDGGMQIIGGDQPYDEGDRVLLINGQPAGRMEAVDLIEKVYI